jgi:hypothetical protein
MSIRTFHERQEDGKKFEKKRARERGREREAGCGRLSGFRERWRTRQIF